jgi:tRNA pseudouridine38-40 synthase
MPRLKLTLEYDGTRYVGWQIQPNGPSLQARVQQALEELLGEPVPVEAAGRTDAGVHATGQVVCFDTPRALPLKAYWMGLNRFLPEDIAVVRAEEVPPEFDPRRWSHGKRYRYRVSNRPSRSPLRRLTHWEVFSPLRVEAMQRAATHLVGRHDFSAFRASDCQAAHAVREVRRLEVRGSTGDELSFVVEGTAFLKHMVRNLVGTLVEVGKGRRPEEWVAEVLASRSRTRAGPTAPAHGLILEEVFYGGGPPARASDDAADGEYEG